MSIKPEISYIVTVYNKENHLKDLFNIIKKQGIKNYEIIFIDDNSSDNSVKIIKSLSKDQKNITLIENKDNKGPAIRLNQADKKQNNKISSSYVGVNLIHIHIFIKSTFHHILV